MSTRPINFEVPFLGESEQKIESKGNDNGNFTQVQSTRSRAHTFSARNEESKMNKTVEKIDEKTILNKLKRADSEQSIKSLKTHSETILQKIHDIKPSKLQQKELEFPNILENSEEIHKMELITGASLSKRATVELRRFSVQETRVRISPSTTPKFEDKTALLDLGAILSSANFYSRAIDEIVQDVLNIYIHRPELTAEIIEGMKNLWTFGSMSKEVAQFQDAEALEKAEAWMNRYNDFLVLLASYDKGIEIICKYFNQTKSEFDHIIRVAHLICERHESKQIVFEMMRIYTLEELKWEQSQTLFREASLSASICSVYLKKQLESSLNKLAVFLANKLKKPADYNFEKKLGNWLKLTEEFLDRFYAIPILENIKQTAKIRRDALVQHFKSTNSAEELEKIVQAGIGSLLFLSVISPFLVQYFGFDPEKDKNTEEDRKTINARQDVVVKITRLVQALANEHPPSEHSNMKGMTPLYNKFIATHKKYIAAILS